MKHASSRELFAYWDERRGRHEAPERGQIEPGPIRKVLGDVFILASGPAGHVFRLAGTRVCALFGHELKGGRFVDLWNGEDRQTIGELVDGVADAATGLVAGARGVTAEGWSHDLELTLLPLRHRGETRARLIGTLAALQVPFWLGTGRIGDLRLSGFRHLHAPRRVEAAQGSRAVRATPFGGVFTVYEGGRQ